MPEMFALQGVLSGTCPAAREAAGHFSTQGKLGEIVLSPLFRRRALGLVMEGARGGVVLLARLNRNLAHMVVGLCHCCVHINRVYCHDFPRRHF